MTWHLGKHRNAFARVTLSLAILLIAACGGKSNKEAQAVDFGTTSGSFLPTTTTNLPGNLFDSTTTSDPLPQTGTSTSLGPITQSENLCLASDNSFYNFGIPTAYPQSSNAVCSVGQSGITPDQLWEAGLTVYSSLNQALTYALQLAPAADFQNDFQQRLALAGIVLIRATRHQLRSEWAFTNWSPQQNQVYAANDQFLYTWLQSASQGGF